MTVDIVGRVGQRAQLSRWLAAAISGQPSVVVVDGAPGVGKSTLVEWLVGQAAEQRVAHRVVTVPESGDITPDLQIGVAGIDDQLRSGAPQLLVIDDAHWLDETGSHHVEHLAFLLGTASVTGQPARMCLVLVVRGDASQLPVVGRLIDEPVMRRLTISPLDDRETRELARRITPGLTDQRTIARLAELSGGNPLTLGALADSISVGEVLPSPASTTGTIPVEVAWRARLATLSDDALRAAIIVALAGPALNGTDLLDGHDAAIDELVTIGAIRRAGGGLVFTHPLLRTTALDLAKKELVEEIAGDVLDRLESIPTEGADAATIVRLSATAQRSGTEHHRQLVDAAFDESIARGSWSAAGDLAEYMVESAHDLPERAMWLERLGKARFNELDRDDATNRLIEAADVYAQCADASTSDAATADTTTASYRSRRADCLLLALRTDFTRGGPRRRTELDEWVAALIDDTQIERVLRARAAAILAEVSFAAPQHDRRQRFIDIAEALASESPGDGLDDPMTEMMVHFASGLHRLAILDLQGATTSFGGAERASLAYGDPWWMGGGLARLAIVELTEGRPIEAVNSASTSIELSARSSNWAEHGLGLAVRAVANTRLGRFSDADNDTESMILSARRADSGDPFVLALPSTMWRRAARGDEPGVAAALAVARQNQLFLPHAEFVATALLHGVEAANEQLRPRWSPPKRGLEGRNLGFHLAQFDAAILAGELEVVDALFVAFEHIHDKGVRASYDWPIGVAVMLATAAIELGDDAGRWIECAEESAARAGSVLEQAALRVQRARYAFISGTGGQAELDQSRAALETLDALGAPLLARLHRERLTAVAGRVGMPSGRTRTVMFTDIVDSTRLMASAGNAAWAVILGEHHRIVRSVVGRFRGSIMTSTGDGFAAWFETPDDAVDAARALHPAIEHAALDVAGGSVTVRVGVASGSVFDLGADASGLAVAEAARVMSTATAGQTHLSRSVIDHGFHIDACRSLGMHTLKGLPDPIEVFALESPTST